MGAAQVNISWQHCKGWKQTDKSLEHTTSPVGGDTKRCKRRTVIPGHAAGYLHQDPRVAEDHDDQWQQEETHECEHVVEGLLPVLDKAPVGGALGEVLGHRDGDVVEYEYLQEEKRKTHTWWVLLH